MAWGSANPVSFLNHWAKRIAVQENNSSLLNQDPHVYLVTKLFQTLSIIKKPGFYGWKFWTAGPSRCIACFVDSDGCELQLTPLGTAASGIEIWWPCIVIWQVDTPGLPFYCPALAWQNARPWGVHDSPLRLRECLPSAPPAVLPSLPQDELRESDDEGADLEQTGALTPGAAVYPSPVLWP